jgi:hypothetical protein
MLFLVQMANWNLPLGQNSLQHHQDMILYYWICKNNLYLPYKLRDYIAFPCAEFNVIKATFLTFHSFIHSLVVSLTTGQKPLPKWSFHIVWSRASSFKWEYPLLFLRSSSSFLCLLPRLSLTSIPPFIFLSITRCRKQFLRKMWPIQFAFRLLISCRIFLCSLTLSNTSSFIP